eukprot:m.124642 g.124642  ORF g.124642 m.124642 type:complete len:403 (+) comp29070_c0_seq2:427-1635(+)
MLRISCPCLNLSFSVERNSGNVTAPRFTSQSQLLRAAIKPDKIANSDFFSEATVSKVDKVVVAHSRLLQLRVAENNDAKTWNIIRCAGCGVDVYARQDASSKYLVNFPKLLCGPSEIETLRLKKQYSPAFKILLLDDISDDGKEPETDDESAAAIRVELEKASREYMAEEERAMKQRVAAFEKAAKTGLRETHDSMEAHRLHMFRLLLRCKPIDHEIVSRVVKRTSISSPRNSPGKTSIPETKTSKSSPLKDASDEFQQLELDDSTFLQASDDDLDNDNDDDDDDEEEDDEEHEDEDEEETQDDDQVGNRRFNHALSQRLEFAKLGSSLPISIPNSMNMARSLSDKKGGATAVRGEMVAASMREMRTRSNTLRQRQRSNSSITAADASDIPYHSPGSPPRRV